MASASPQDKPVEPDSEPDAASAAAEPARAAAEALLRFNLTVSGILAHDLKNPVAGVLMNARLLAGADADGARRLGARIVTSAERMSRMIDHIGEWARLQSSGDPASADRRLPLACLDCDLGVIAETLIADLRARKPEIPISLTCDGPLAGHWDADRLSQVVSNLLSNAIDYAAVPGVAVALAGGSSDEVTLSVANAGSISDDALPLLFEPFRGRSRGPGLRGRGLGMGLFLTREIVRAHGGRIEVDRATEGRVRFVVSLPRFAP
jgi:two-component system sensor histidine kinase/response regulator